MFAELRSALRPALLLLVLLTLLTGVVYPFAVTGIAQLVFPAQANGSLIHDGDRIVGSSLIGQNFARGGYFHGRLSAAGKGYDATASSGSNLSPTSKDLATRIAASVKAERDAGMTGVISADLVTTSASGLDPDVGPEAAFSQVPRIAAARGVAADKVRALVEGAIDRPLLGFIGEPHVNVLMLNRQLDRIAATPAK